MFWSHWPISQVVSILPVNLVVISMNLYNLSLTVGISSSKFQFHSSNEQSFPGFESLLTPTVNEFGFLILRSLGLCLQSFIAIGYASSLVL